MWLSVLSSPTWGLRLSQILFIYKSFSQIKYLNHTSPYQNVTLWHEGVSHSGMGWWGPECETPSSDIIHIYMPPVVTRGGRSVGGIVTFRQLVVLLKFSPPTWLTECFSADHCLSSLLDDYQSAGSIFRGSELFVLFQPSSKCREAILSSQCLALLWRVIVAFSSVQNLSKLNLLNVYTGGCLFRISYFDNIMTISTT